MRCDRPLSHWRAVPLTMPQVLSDTRAIATKMEPEHRHLHAGRRAALVDELREDRGEEHDHLGVRYSRR